MIYTAREISKQLSARAESFASFLFPNGKREGAEWCVGSLNGESGHSLKIHLSGDRAGLWADFADNPRGDLLDLIVDYQRTTFVNALKFAKDWLGIREPESVTPRRTYAKPAPKNVEKVTLESPVVEYLKEDRRLTDSTIKAFRISECNNGNGMEIAFPSFDPSGSLVNVKYIALQRDERGKKFIRQEKGCPPSLFGWQALNPVLREVLISEGQIDAMTWHQMGFPALSIPDGTGNDEWIDYDWNNLQQFDTIYLSYDNDEAGQKAIRNVANRLGLHRCFIVRFDKWKDANEALQKGATKDDFSRAIAISKPISPDQIKKPVDFRDKVIEKFYPPEGVKPGFWPRLFDNNLGLRPGEVTLWTGISGHGKSVLLNQLMLEAAIFNHKVAIASMEMLGEQTLYRMICQSETDLHPQKDQIDQVLCWLSGRIWIYDLLGNVPPKEILELMEYSYARHGVSQFVIDSLMKCSVGSDDYDGQRQFLNDLTAFAKKNAVHISLVAHARKGRDEGVAPNKMDVKGSVDIINQADNILSILRNKEQEEKAPQDRTNPDARVICSKQRETGTEFVVSLKFNPNAFRFSRFGNQGPDNLCITELIKRDKITDEEFVARPPARRGGSGQ